MGFRSTKGLFVQDLSINIVRSYILRCKMELRATLD